MPGLCICTNIIPVNLNRNVNLFFDYTKDPTDPLGVGDVALGCRRGILSSDRFFVAGWSPRRWKGFERDEESLRRCCEVARRCRRDVNPRLPATAPSREMQVGRGSFWTLGRWEMMGWKNFANLSVKLVVPSSLASAMLYKSLLQSVLCCYSDTARAHIPLLLDLDDLQLSPGCIRCNVRKQKVAQDTCWKLRAPVSVQVLCPEEETSEPQQQTRQLHPDPCLAEPATVVSRRGDNRSRAAGTAGTGARARVSGAKPDLSGRSRESRLKQRVLFHD